jgi:Septum formation initiator
MARNRKYQSAAIRFGPALKAFLLCLLIGGSGVGYVWQKNQIFDLGQQIRKREKLLAELENQNDKLKRQLAWMQSPRYLEGRIRDLNLGLVQPEQSKIWWLRETPRLERPERPGSETAPPATPTPRTAQAIALR